MAAHGSGGNVPPVRVSNAVAVMEASTWKDTCRLIIRAVPPVNMKDWVGLLKVKENLNAMGITAPFF